MTRQVVTRQVSRRGGGWRALPWLAPAALFYAAFLVVPYALVLRLSLFRFSSVRLYVPEWTAANYVAMATDPFYWRLVLRTVALGFGVTLACVVLGLPLALRVARAGPRLKAALLAVVLSPLLVNLVIRTYAWLVLLGDGGVVNHWLLALGVVAAPLPLGGNMFAVVVGLVHLGLPLMVLSLLGSLGRIAPVLLDAADSLGASRARVLWRVVLPLAVPGIGAGSILVFAFTVGAFVTPSLLGGNRVSTVSTLIYEKFTFSANWPVGATLVVVLLAVNLVVALGHARLFRDA